MSKANHPVLTPTACFQAGHSREAVKQILVQWSHSPLEDATWEDLAEFGQLYNLPDLEDKVDFNGKGSDSWAGLELTDNKVQERLKKWVEDEAQEGGAQGDAEAQEGRAQGKTIGFKGRFEKRGNRRAKSNKGILEEGSGVERSAKARRTPGWLDSFELKGKR